MEARLNSPKIPGLISALKTPIVVFISDFPQDLGTQCLLTFPCISRPALLQEVSRPAVQVSNSDSGRNNNNTKEVM